MSGFPPVTGVFPMSGFSPVTGIIPANKSSRISMSRLHRSTEENAANMSLIEDMKKVFSQCFEEKPGRRVFSTELRDVFETSAQILSESEKGVFLHHANRLFKKRWPGAKAHMWRNRRCFINVAVKEMHKI